MGFASWFLGNIFVVSVFLGFVNGATHYYDFVVEDSNFTRLCRSKMTPTVNDSFPGPEIHAHKGDTIFVTVHNQAAYGITLHWHGSLQMRNPWSDGPENITQCPISPGTNFTQEINLTTEEGTLWWHAHSPWLRDTIHGALIIHPPHDNYPFPKPDGEEIFILGSWYGQSYGVVETGIRTDVGGFLDADAYTINGQPGDLYNCSKESTYRMEVEYGKTYLLRIINAVVDESMFFGIYEHNLTIVSLDAGYVKNITVDYVVVHPGQTMDVLVTANRSPNQYHIASYPFDDSNTYELQTTIPTTAIFEYRGNYTPSSFPILPIFPPANDSDTVMDFTNKIKALASKEHPVRVPINITTSIFMTTAINFNHSVELGMSLNNISFEAPTNMDVLQAYYRGMNGIFSSDFPHEPPTYFNFTGNTDGISENSIPGTKVIVVNYGEAVEIIYQGTNLTNLSTSHAMHLHGFNFYMVGQNKGNFNKLSDPIKYNLIDPPEVNTVNVFKEGWLALRFFANNPGVWLLHCHIEDHQNWGMGTVLIVKDGSTPETSIRSPPPYMPPCPANRSQKDLVQWQ